MNFMPIDKLGPHTSGSRVHFGILLPGLSTQNGYKVQLRIIHEDDQFIQTEPAYHKLLKHSINPVYGDYWETTIDMPLRGSGKHWGKPGRYIYRYAVIKPDGKEIDWIIDPFAREFGIGRHAAFTYGYKGHKWSKTESKWKTPRHHDLVLYEMNIMEFAGSLERASKRLDYLQDLGINCISLMPVTNITEVIDWGYTPIGYFGVDERFGKRRDFQQFVQAAHEREIAVLVDAIYGHTSSLFAYEHLYSQLDDVTNPIMGSFSKDMFAPSVDWTKPFAQDFFYTVNRHWLETYHVDGFRYDCVPNYWELGPSFQGYASIVYNTYQFVKSQISADNPKYTRFKDGNNPIRLIQCAEQLEAVEDVLEQTYSTCTWQNETISAAEKVAMKPDGPLTQLGFALGAKNWPIEATVNGDRLFKSPLQYIENHDHDRFICNFGKFNPDHCGNVLFEQGDRNKWYKLQPYLIGLLMAKGIPLLWQGQELCQNSKIASGGVSRTGFLRLVNWEYFYDDTGRNIITLVRDLLKIRSALTHTRDGEYYFFNDHDRYLQQGVLLFARYYPNTPTYTLAALNFTDETKRVPFWFPVAGDYREELHHRSQLRGNSGPSPDLVNVPSSEEYWVEVPSNYGRVWTHV